jgi:fibronectin type 3 domain-containing protein
MPAGEYTFVVHSYSTTRFGESPEGTEISFTLEPVTMLPPANLTQSIVNGNDIVLKWNPSTYANSYKVYRIIGGEKVLKSTVTGTTVKYTIMPEGAYTFEVHSFSTRFGESPEASKLDFELVWPEVVSPILKGDVFNANNITLSWQAVTGTKEYRIYEVKGAERELLYKGNVLTYKLYNLTEDTHYYEVTAYSIRFGESAPSNRLIENIIYPIMQPPTAALSLLSTTSARISWDFVVYANGYNIYEIVNGQPVLLVKNLNNLSYTLTDLPYADHEYIVTSVSNSFGESEPSNKVIAKLIVDTEPPVTKANAPTGWTNQNPVTVTLSATDDETGVANTYYAINDGTFTAGTSVMIENDGVTKISFYSVDKVGNIETAKTIEVKIDKTAPVTKTSEVPAWSKEPVTVTLSATDAQSGVAKTLYAIDDSPYNEGTTFTIGEEGIHKVTFYSVDVAGNIESTQTIEVKIDKTAPVVTMDLQEEYKLGTTVPLAFLASDNLSGIADAKMTVYGPDDAAGQVVPNGTAFLLDKAGVYKITVTATDAAGLTTTIQKQFVVFIPATIEVTPKVMKGNDGIFTVRVELPEGYSTQDFDLNTATLNGVKALTSNNGYYNQAKLGQFKFERSDFNWTPSETIVTFRCYVDGNLVVGQTTVKVQK